MNYKKLLIIFILPLITYANTFYINKFKQYNFSYAIFDLKKSKYIQKYNIHQKFPPASLLKIFSSYYLIKYFPDSLLKNNIYGLDGFLVNDTILYGNVIIKLTGNPLTGSEYSNIPNPINNFFKIIKQKRKINKIKKDIIIDYSYLPYIKENNYIYNYQKKWFYAAPACGINYNLNSFSIIINNYKNIPFISISPPIADINIAKNIHYLANIKSNIHITINKFNNIKITGQINKNIKTYTLKLSITQPDIFIQKLIKYYLNFYKITLNGKIIVSKKSYIPIELDTLLIEKPYSLEKILKIANFESSNFIFEQLFLILQQNDNTNLISNWVKYILKDKNFNIVDYSGLSEKNYLSINQFIELLTYIYNSDYLTWQKLINVLPTDKKIQFFNNIKYENITIKTGLLENTFSLFLYSDKSQRIYIFFFDKIKENNMKQIIKKLKKLLLNFNQL